MALIFDALPGLPVAVGSIGRGLADMWGKTAAAGQAPHRPRKIPRQCRSTWSCTWA